ncbi:HdeD family acid-resistance protein, partial [Acinetobacter ursingii]
MMKTVGNDLIRNQLHADRKWYLLLGVLLVIFGLVLLAA